MIANIKNKKKLMIKVLHINIFLIMMKILSLVLFKWI